MEIEPLRKSVLPILQLISTGFPLFARFLAFNITAPISSGCFKNNPSAPKEVGTFSYPE